ncbi:hypothetical protein L218DRAFT_970178 [Marasmius fiardii PR-910]|nr:hypothetical protein L218DRAFT_970178 [Marasmius fiardii PR-910]
MPRIYLKEIIFGGKTFCCCLPVRFGLISMSFLGILFGGILSLVCWFEVANAAIAEMEGPTKAAFIVGGLVETILFVASMLGFIGAIVRKQSFVQTYAYILYVHFVLNLVVAIYLLVMVSKVSSVAIAKACQQTVKDAGAQEQCAGLFKNIRAVIIVVACIVLFVELYGAIIAARYVNQIQREKRGARASRIQAAEDFEIQMSNRNSQMPRRSSQPPDFSQDFNPYEAMDVHDERNATAGASHDYQSVPLHDENEGHGGGSWTHEQLADKARLRRLNVADGDGELPNPFLGRDEIVHDDKSAHGPSQAAG